MLAVSVELLHGTFRGDPDGTASTGTLTRGEWPPAPARLFAALVAADGTGSRCRVTDGSELEWFEQLQAPVIHADASPCHQALRPRYVVSSSPEAKKVHMEYIARVGNKIRPGVRVTPRCPRIIYKWEATTPPEVTEALQRRAARIGYLGAADSPVRVRVGTCMASLPGVSLLDAFVPDPEGTLAISVPKEGDLQLLDKMHEAWLEQGASIGRAQFPALRHQASYRAPSSGLEEDRGSVVAWLRLTQGISGRRVSALTGLFKKAVLSRYQELHGEPPPILHGHGLGRKGFDLARYLALPDVGFRRSRGRIHGLALWLPPENDAATRQRVRSATLSIQRLTSRTLDVAVRPSMGEHRPVAAAPERWTQAARCWVTAFPAVHERRGSLGLEEVSRWCEHAGLPGPIAFRSARCPLVAGGVDLAPAEVNRPGRPRLPYSHVQVWFDAPVRGPVVLGSARQRGLGLCVPVHDGSADPHA